MHGHRIDEHNIILEIGEFFLHQSRRHSSPEATHFQDVCFVDHRQLATPSTSRLSRHTYDSLNLVGGINGRTKRFFATVCYSDQAPAIAIMSWLEKFPKLMIGFMNQSQYR